MDAELPESMLYYFAYGSNLHPVRLHERVPSAQLVGPVELLGHRLAFHKRGQDGSAKCNLVRTDDLSDRVYGAIYQMVIQEKPILDQYEGKGNGYSESPIVVACQGRAYSCFTYFAQASHLAEDLKPFHWYKNLVVFGAKYLRFPASYVRSIELIESVEDPGEKRKKEHEALIAKIINFSSTTKFSNKRCSSQVKCHRYKLCHAKDE